MSETAKYRHLTTQYCNGNGIDVGSQGDPVVPWAIQVELPEPDYFAYGAAPGKHPYGVWRGDGRILPFREATLDFVYSSHLLEDFKDWTPALREWIRVLKKGGCLVILMPDEDLFNAAVARGQPPNCAHQHMGKVGALTDAIERIHPFHVIADRLTACHVDDYSILFAGVKQ